MSTNLTCINDCFDRFDREIHETLNYSEYSNGFFLKGITINLHYMEKAGRLQVPITDLKIGDLEGEHLVLHAKYFDINNPRITNIFAYDKDFRLEQINRDINDPILIQIRMNQEARGTTPIEELQVFGSEESFKKADNLFKEKLKMHNFFQAYKRYYDKK